MKQSVTPGIGLALPIAAVVVFAMLLTFSLIRMFEVENAMRVQAEQNMLWVLHQSEVAALRMAQTAALVDLGEAEQSDLALRFDILASRIAMLNDGPQRRFMIRIGLAGDLDRVGDELATLAPIIEDYSIASGPRLRRALDPIARVFGRAANAAMITEWDDLGGRLEAYRSQLRQTIASLIGIMIAGGTLAVMLVLALRQSRARNDMLHRERDFSGLLISSSGEGILAVDTDARCTLWNDAMAALIGKDARQAVDHDLATVAGFFDTAPIRRNIARALVGKPSQMTFLPLFAADSDRPRYVDLRFYPMYNDGGIVGAILFMQDASDRYAARQKDVDTRDRLEELVTERTRDLHDALRRERSAADIYRNFAAMVSHQFRTPLAVADSALQRLIRRGPRADKTEIDDRANRARSAIAGLTRLVDSTLDAARLDAGQIGARRVKCDLSDIARTVCSRQRDAAPDLHITLNDEIQDNAAAFCDPAHGEQILENLLSNAAKYADPETAVSVTLHTDENWVFCDVHNCAAPIAPDDSDRIFERNRRGANTAGVPGTGIGLFMARALARMQGGDVTLQPTASGVTFRMTLPRFAEDLT